MPEETKPNDNLPSLTEEQIRSYTMGEPELLSGRILIVDYDPQWPELFKREADRIRTALGDRALRIEHTGSTAVPDLVAKPIIDVLLAVSDSGVEDEYVPALEAAGYVLRIRETNWFEHRMFKGPDTDINLHVFSLGCPEISRMLVFRDWLRNNAADRDLYARTKMALAQKRVEVCAELRRCEDSHHPGDYGASQRQPNSGPISKMNPLKDTFVYEIEGNSDCPKVTKGSFPAKPTEKKRA